MVSYFTLKKQFQLGKLMMIILTFSLLFVGFVYSYTNLIEHIGYELTLLTGGLLILFTIYTFAIAFRLDLEGN